MQFLVVGTDGPDFEHEPCDLHEIHQVYMDGWREALVARGPMLSADGEEHTGSVHVVEVADLEVARSFAFEEPFARHGWYSEVTVTPVLPCVDGTMWDRPAATPGGIAAFVRAEFVPDRVGAVGSDLGLARSDDPPWLYLALTLDHDGRAAGLVGLVDLSPARAGERIGALMVDATGATPAHIACDRWQRGGRSDDTRSDEEA